MKLFLLIYTIFTISLVDAESPTIITEKNKYLSQIMYTLFGQNATEFVSTSRHPHKRPYVLYLMLYDVFGSITAGTHGGARCFLTFIDDHSRKVLACICTQNKRSNNLCGIQKFHSSVE